MEKGTLLAGYTILMVNDNRRVLESHCEELLAHGASCQGVRSREAAIEAFREKKFDLVLMNLKIAKMDGFKAIKMIKGLPEYQSCEAPIIAHSAMLYKHVEKQIRKSKMNGYIISFLELETFVRAIALALSYHSTKGVGLRDSPSMFCVL